MRVVSLCPSLTELVFDLGLGQALVGITRYCVHPAEGVARVETVGGTKDPDVARIVDLAPDLILLNEEENRAEDAAALAEAGLACHVSFPRDVPQTAAMVRSIGDALGAGVAAETIAAEIEARAEHVRRAALDAPPVRWAYLIWRKPYMAVNADTFTHGLLALAGGENVFGDHPERFPTVEPEDLAQAAPDRVLLSSEPFPFEQQHARELAEATGLPPERFRLVDGELLSWHGSRTRRGIDYAAQVLGRPHRPA